MTENVLKFGGHITAILQDALSCFRVELAWGMPNRGTFFGRFVSFSFRCMQVKQLWTFHISKLLQYTYYLLNIVSVKRAEVTDVHSLEDILLMTQCTL